MKVDRFGLSASTPTGWQLAIARRPSSSGEVIPHAVGRLAEEVDVTHPVLHACTRALPADVGDFGGGVVELLGSEDIFVALLEYGSDVADAGLFARRGIPRLAPSQFEPNRMPRLIPGRSASQHFFSQGGRAFCLYTVIGSHARRMATVPRAAAVVRTISVTDAATMRRFGGMP